MANPWDGLTDSIIATVRSEAGDFLDQHKDAADFLKDRAARAAQLLYLIERETDQDQKAIMKSDLARVKNTIALGLDDIALDAEEAAKTTFSKILKAVFEFAIQHLPAALALLGA